MKINDRHLCIGCMRQLYNAQTCTYCGLVQKDYHPAPRCMIPGTRLRDRYILGKVLGEGNFGITYIGWDEILDIPVAIKEYFPAELVSRDVLRSADSDVYLYANQAEEEYQKQLDNFLKEARNLTRFNDLQAIVSVRDFFYANQTAYIVMDYVTGESLKSYIKRHGPMDAHRMLTLFQPVLLALQQVHAHGIIHRDISPDNLLLSEDHKLVLIDFGAAKLSNAEVTRSLTVQFKRGFSPEEQYRSMGKQGAWTDIYALCATMYYCLTGITPDESIQRTIADRLVPLSEYSGISLSKRQMQAIAKGMAVVAKNRYQQVGELYHALYAGNAAGAFQRRSSLRKKLAISALAVLLVIGVSTLFAVGRLRLHRQQERAADTTQTIETKTELLEKSTEQTTAAAAETESDAAAEKKSTDAAEKESTTTAEKESTAAAEKKSTAAAKKKSATAAKKKSAATTKAAAVTEAASSNSTQQKKTNASSDKTAKTNTKSNAKSDTKSDTKEGLDGYIP